MFENIRIRGAAQHNLKNIDVTIPRNKLVVVTGLSGSGASMIVEIRFDNGAVKKLAAGFAPLEILE